MYQKAKKIAVGVKYSFIIVPAYVTREIELYHTGRFVYVNGTRYPLYFGASRYAEMRIDRLIEKVNDIRDEKRRVSKKPQKIGA